MLFRSDEKRNDLINQKIKDNNLPLKLISQNKYEYTFECTECNKEFSILNQTFNQRIKNKILNSGATGNQKITSKMFGLITDPDSNAYKHYKLRAMCNKLPYVDYTPTLQSEYVNDKYPLLLSKYAAAIAATTTFPTIKYWEIPAAGTLTFMEITDLNMGKYLGFVDGKSTVFINENNYKQKFEEYLHDLDDPKWEEIALAGRKYALDELNNDKAVTSLVDLITELMK